MRTQVANFPSILLVSAKVAIIRNIVPFSMYEHSKNEHEIHASGISDRDELGIPLRLNVMHKRVMIVNGFCAIRLLYEKVNAALL